MKLSVTSKTAFVATTVLLIASSGHCFGQSSLPLTTESAHTASSSSAASSSVGRATRDVEKWTTQFQESRKQIENIQQQVFTQVPQAMRQSTARLNSALDVHRKGPTAATRRALQQTTVDVLRSVHDSLHPIVDEQPRILLAVTQLETNVQKRAASLRSEAEQLDASLPGRVIELAGRRNENNQLKDSYLAQPSDRQLEMKLRARFFEEKKLDGEIQRDHRLRELKTQAASGLFVRAREVQALHDAMLDTFVNLDLARQECADTAALLALTMEYEDELSALGGGMGVSDVLAAAESGWQASSDLIDQLNQAMSILMEPKELPEGGEIEIPNTEFQRWLDQRGK